MSEEKLIKRASTNIYGGSYKLNDFIEKIKKDIPKEYVDSIFIELDTEYNYGDNGGTSIIYTYYYSPETKEEQTKRLEREDKNKKKTEKMALNKEKTDLARLNSLAKKYGMKVTK